MSAVLTTDDIQPVADLLEKLQNVQRAMRDMHDASTDQDAVDGEYSCAISIHPKVEKDAQIAFTHRLPYWVVLRGLGAMESELRMQLEAKGITVESALP